MIHNVCCVDLPPLIAAISVKKDNALLQQLIADGHNVNECTKDSLKTPLQCAAWAGNVEAVRMLLDAGAEVSLQDAEGHTALHMVILGHIRNQQQRELTSAYAAIVDLLLTRDPKRDLGKQQNNHGDTPGHMAVRNVGVALVKILDKFGLIFNIQNNAGETPDNLIIKLQRKVNIIADILSKNMQKFH